MTRLTRRGALAALATLAGCGGANPLSSSDTTELDAAALRAAVADSPPSVPDRLPVGVGSEHLQASERRARTLLDAVPADLGPDEIPNGAIREEVRRVREGAAERVVRATEAASPFERLSALAGARADARFAAAAWRAIDAGLTHEDVADEATAVREDRRALWERWSYVGGDPVDAALVHAAIEDRLDTADRIANLGRSRHYRAGNPLAVGEAAEDLEDARVAVDDAAHIYDRQTTAVDDPTDLRPRLLAAAESLREAFDAERSALDLVEPDADAPRPWEPEGVDLSRTPVGGALEGLYRSIRPGAPRDPPDGQTVARSLLHRHESFASLWAFESLRARVADDSGEAFAVDSADDVATIRADAVAALRAADAEPRVPALTRAALVDLTRQVAWVDGDIADRDRDVPVRALHHEVSTYLVVGARAREVPRASERVAEALRS
ncbi:hypothetical protein [Haloplanus salilacus]|uniref:hypothetical protein n=1 Tax=Haloplanus salilacus TaxID=2949994 RepID=UPI0030D438E0